MRKIIILLVAAVCVLMSTAVPILGIDVTASVTVNKQCGLDSPTGSETVSFGHVLENSVTVSVNTVAATLTSNTNAETTVTIGGTDWCTGTFLSDGTCDNPSTPSMLVGKTAWSLDSGSSWHDLAIKTSPATLFTSSTPSHSETTTFKLDVPTVQPAGAYGQKITYDFSCDQG